MLVGTRTILRRIEQSDLWRLWQWHEANELLLLREVKPHLSWDELNERYAELFAWQGAFLAEKKDGPAFGIYEYRDLNWKNRCCRVSMQLIDTSPEHALDALQTMTAFLFDELGLFRLHASVPVSMVFENEILKCSGFACEGKLREAHFTDGDYHDVRVYALLREDAESTKA